MLEKRRGGGEVRHMNLHSLVFFYLLSSGGTELEIPYQILQVSSASPQRIRIRRNPWEPEEEKGYKRRMSPEKWTRST